MGFQAKYNAHTPIIQSCRYRLDNLPRTEQHQLVVCGYDGIGDPGLVTDHRRSGIPFPWSIFLGPEEVKIF